jgi:hypothetical protein
MPLSSFLNLSPAEATAKSGTIPALGLFIATSTTGHSTNSSAAISQDGFALLSKLQGTPIHAPPGLHPLRAGAQSITKTQLQIERRATKEVKAKAAEDKKLTVAARRTEAQAKKQERQEKLISSAEARAAKAVAKANKLHIKLAKLPQRPHLFTVQGPLPLAPIKRAKGIPGFLHLAPADRQYSSSLLRGKQHWPLKE